MFSNQKESTEFIHSLKRAGIAIGNEQEVIERLEEAREWRYAFSTLNRPGSSKHSEALNLGANRRCHEQQALPGRIQDKVRLHPGS